MLSINDIRVVHDISSEQEREIHEGGREREKGRAKGRERERKIRKKSENI